MVRFRHLLMSEADISQYGLFTNRSHCGSGGEMPKPPVPPDLRHCPDCGKVKGDQKGWFDPQCFCEQPKVERKVRPGDHWA